MTTSQFEDAPNLEAELAELAKQPPPLIVATAKVADTEKAEARETIDAARARVALETRIKDLVECSLLDGWFKAKLAAGERGVPPADVEIVHTMLSCAAKIMARREGGQP